jgi:hypothetical protein
MYSTCRLSAPGDRARPPRSTAWRSERTLSCQSPAGTQLPTAVAQLQCPLKASIAFTFEVAVAVGVASRRPRQLRFRQNSSGRGWRAAERAPSKGRVGLVPLPATDRVSWRGDLRIQGCTSTRRSGVGDVDHRASRVPSACSSGGPSDLWPAALRTLECQPDRRACCGRRAPEDWHPRMRRPAAAGTATGLG